jgi:nucleoside-diphosphate-sugar epimerase
MVSSANHRWIITGCNGNLGKALCLLLGRRGLPVAGFCRPGRDVTTLVSAGVPCHTYDEFAGVVGDGDVVVHCAGRTGTQGSWSEFEKTNVDFSVELSQLVASRGASAFVYVSSIAALGYANRSGQDTLVEDDLPVLGRGESYGKSKHLAERRLAELCGSGSMRLVVLRPGLVYGSSGGDEPRVERPPPVLDPRQRVPLVHVSNFADAVVLSAEVAGPVATYNVVDEEQPCLSDLNRLKHELGRLTGLPRKVSRGRFAAAYCARALVKKLLGRPTPARGTLDAVLRFHGRRSLYTTMALREATGWRPLVSLVAGWEQMAGCALRPSGWKPAAPRRVGLWWSGERLADAALARVASNGGPVEIIAEARTSEAVLEAQRRRHFDCWVVLADVADDLLRAIRAMAWGCRDVCIVHTTEQQKAGLLGTKIPGVALRFGDS